MGAHNNEWSCSVWANLTFHIFVVSELIRCGVCTNLADGVFVCRWRHSAGQSIAVEYTQ